MALYFECRINKYVVIKHGYTFPYNREHFLQRERGQLALLRLVYILVISDDKNK